MNKKRLIYVAGLSNDEHIGHYIREDILNMKSIFESFENENKIIFRTDEFVTKKNLIERFSSANILPWLFYFSGHSDDNSISLSDGVVSVENFATIFDNNRVRDSLQLVYLGSCRSISIGKRLIENNIKLVIASTVAVPAYLANIISKLFFNRFLISDNIQEAFDQTRNDYEIDRSNFNVNKEIDFPWELLSSNESYILKGIKKINLSSEQKHQIIMNTASIRLDFMDYYLSEDKSDSKKVELIKDVTHTIKSNLATYEEIDNQTSLKSLVNIWKKSDDLVTKSNRLFNVSKDVRDLPKPAEFIKNTKIQISNMLDRSDKILKY